MGLAHGRLSRKGQGQLKRGERMGIPEDSILGVGPELLLVRLVFEVWDF